ncbi:hypothetical protein VZT92_025299 [Zoarces viviparus]|uniref:SET domain-containing protein n=1 Tax=Zoarces viviparus TaxID=48416 RepID=A0AAW1E1E9_ZOAVI
MPKQSKKRSLRHNMVHCLKCNKPQKCISVHLRRVCMKNNMPEEQATELAEMKDSARLWILESRTWEYKEICEILPHKPSRIALLKAILQRGFLVNNPPHEGDLSDAPAPSSSPAASISEATSSTTAAVSSEPDSSSDPDAGPSDPTWQKDLPAVTTKVRTKMQAAGLYKKFSGDAEVIKDFKKYLSVDLDVTNCQQEVDNVARFLRYMQPTGDVPTLDFLKKSTDTRDFFQDLKNTDMTAATILNYIKNILHFVDYLRNRLALVATNSEFRNQCQAYKELVETLRKAIFKTNSKDSLSTRYQRFVDGTRSLRECQEVLRVAEKEFLHIFGMLINKDSAKVSAQQRTYYRYYLEAILVLRHFQRPGAVEGMSVREWLDRKPVDNVRVIGISNHKTATTQLASFAISQEEEAWFQPYYKHIRPGFIGDLDSCDRFFTSAKGTAVSSVTNDLGRMHESQVANEICVLIYKVSNVTSQEVRRIAQTEVDSTFTTSQKEGVARRYMAQRYMAHTTAVAKTHYRMLDPASVVQTAVLLGKLSGCSPQRASQTDEASGQQEDRTFDSFIAAFPVTNDGRPPSQKQRTDAGFSPDRTFCDKWRGLQYVNRRRYLLSHFQMRKPAAGSVSRAIAKEGWQTNHPSADEVVKMWRPASRENVEGDKHVINSVDRQKWKGVAIKDFGGEKGLGVVATRQFARGDILCDYHGEVITAKKGNKKMPSINDQAGYMFFFTFREKHLCVDAQSDYCKCHPQLETVGRLINHSSKRPNVKPAACLLNINSKDTTVILFKALGDIKVDEELKFDYGVKRKSFRGEGLDLQWLEE